MESPDYETAQKLEDQSLTPFKNRALNTMISNFQFAGEIGKGKFGSVFKVINKITNNVFALKAIELPSDDSESAEMIYEVIEK